MASTNVDWYRVAGPPFTGVALQTAINTAAAGGGGVVYLPAGVYSLTTPIEIPFDASDPVRPIMLLGDGPNATKLVNGQAPFGPDPLMRIRRSLVTVRGIAIDGVEPASIVPFRGIVIDGSMGPVSGVELADIIVRSTSSHALHIAPGPQPNDVRRCRYKRCTFAANGSNAGVRIEPGAFDHDFQDCHIDFFGGGALDLVGCDGIVFHNGAIEAPNDLSSLSPYVRSRGARNCHLINVWFEEPGPPAIVTQSPWFVDLEVGSDGWTISGCHFIRKTGVGGVLRAVRVGNANGPCLGVTIINPFIRRDSNTLPLPGHIEINNSGSECLVIGGIVETGFAPGIERYPVDVADASTKSGWIGHRRWRPPTLNTAEVESVTANRHLGDILVRLGQGVQAYSAKSPPTGPIPWLPMSVNRVANESVMNGISLSAKDKGTIVWVDSPNPGNSNLRVYNGSTWNQLTLV